MMHTPVLLKEVIEALDIKKGGLYIDATFGEGGHTSEILKRGGKVLAIDLDLGQVQSSKFKVQSFEGIKIVQGNFANIEKIAKENKFYPVDGVLFDLGLSMVQLESSDRGFSFKKTGEALDMRINQNEQSEKASDWLNLADEEELYQVFARYGEEIDSRLIAQAIVTERKRKKIETVGDLISIISQIGRQEAMARRIFQAIRIRINDEISNLKEGLAGSLAILNQAGRIVVISFQSLEDRVVKNFIKNNQLQQINKKIIKGSPNLSFERSAKMRIIKL